MSFHLRRGTAGDLMIMMMMTVMMMTAMMMTVMMIIMMVIIMMVMIMKIKAKNGDDYAEEGYK